MVKSAVCPSRDGREKAKKGGREKRKGIKLEMEKEERGGGGGEERRREGRRKRGCRG